MKKALIIAVVVVALAAAALYLFVLRPAPEAAPLTFAPGDYFVTNIKDSNHLLKTAVVLLIDGGSAYKKLPARLEERLPEVRDSIIFILRELSEEEVRASGVEKALRERIRRSINDLLATEGIRDVLFSDFVMQ
jgi:flagellar FliL protein